MHSRTISITSSEVEGLDQILTKDRLQSEYSVHNLGSISVVVLEVGYLSILGAGTLSSTVIIDKRDLQKTAVTVISAGSARGLLRLRGGQEQKVTRQLVEQLIDYCRQNNWPVSEA